LRIGIAEISFWHAVCTFSAPRFALAPLAICTLSIECRKLAGQSKSQNRIAPIERGWNARCDRRITMRTTVALSFVAALSGCAHSQGVRYVYQDRDFGVIGMPENTDRWPTHYRRQGDKLMDAHFPGGHEIVRAEEVIEGERTLKVEGSKSAEVSPQLSNSLLRVVKLGHSANRSEAETVKVKECRIIYKRVDCTGPTGYCRAATLTPTLYVDPNAVERRKITGAANPTSGQQAKHETENKAAKTP
jgi:hypothetical protein